MTPATGTAVLILAAFVLPGFVTLMIKERTYEVPSQASAFDRLLATLYYSALVYAGPALVIAIAGWDVDQVRGFIEGDDGLRGPVAAAIGVIVVMPLLVAYVGHRWSGSDVRDRVLARIGFNPAHASATSNNGSSSGGRRVTGGRGPGDSRGYTPIGHIPPPSGPIKLPPPPAPPRKKS